MKHVPSLEESLIKFMMQGQLTVLVTGQTNKIRAERIREWIKYVDEDLPIRILNCYKNIEEYKAASYEECIFVSGLYSDTSILETIYQTISNSGFSIISLDAKSPKKAIYKLGNAVCNSLGLSLRESIRLVVEVIPFSIHLGEKHVDRIIEFNNALEIYRDFELTTLLYFNPSRNKYKPLSWLSLDKHEYLVSKISCETDKKALMKFKEAYWKDFSHIRDTSSSLKQERLYS